MNIEIAERLVKLRKENGYSQETLAAELGLSRQAVSKWERAEASPDTDNLICLARLYNMSLDELLNTTDSTEEIITSVKDKQATKTNKKKDIVNASITSIVTLAVVIAYLLLGFLKDLWHPYWVLFLLIPITSSLIDAIIEKRVSKFLFPVLITIFYVLISDYKDLWHPLWIIYLTIPIFYSVSTIIDKATGHYVEPDDEKEEKA